MHRRLFEGRHLVFLLLSSYIPFGGFACPVIPFFLLQTLPGVSFFLLLFPFISFYPLSVSSHLSSPASFSSLFPYRFFSSLALLHRFHVFHPLQHSHLWLSVVVHSKNVSYPLHPPLLDFPSDSLNFQCISQVLHIIWVPFPFSLKGDEVLLICRYHIHLSSHN